MMSKTKVVLHSRDTHTIRDLRLLLAEWCELHAVDEFKSLDHFCREQGQPHALICENESVSPVHGEGTKDVMTELLVAVRSSYPAIRRVVITDAHDLGTTIRGLHARTIDSVLHRPFTLASVLTAIRFEKPQVASPKEAETARR